MKWNRPVRTDTLETVIDKIGELGFTSDIARQHSQKRVLDSRLWPRIEIP